MKREKVYIVIIILLLVLNIIQLVGSMMKPKHRPHRDNFKANAVKILELNQEQIPQFEELVQSHRARMEDILKKQKGITQQYFDSPNEKSLEEISKIDSEKIKVTEKHFNDIESILNSDQIPAFEKFKKEAIKHILQ